MQKTEKLQVTSDSLIYRCLDIYSLVSLFFWRSWIQEQQPQPIRIILLPSTLQIIRLSQGFQHDYIYYIKKSTYKESLCTKRCSLATLQPRVNHEQSRWLWWLQWHPNRDDCARTWVHVRHSPSLSPPLLFQSALLSAQSSLTEEEEEEKHAGHLRLPQEPQPNFVQSGSGGWGGGLWRWVSHRCHGTHRVCVRRKHNTHGLRL